MPEIIPAAKLRLVPWEKDEEFLIIRKARNKLVVIGLRKYLSDLKTRMVALRNSDLDERHDHIGF